jgi:hypothetical protein
MRRFTILPVLAASLFLGLVSPVLSQDLRSKQNISLDAPVAQVPTQATPQNCHAILAALPFELHSDKQTVEQSGSDCLIRHIRFGSGHVAYLVDSLWLHGFTSDFDDFPAKFPERPIALRVEARGITFSPEINGNAKLVWMISQQQVPFDVTFDSSYDPASQRVTLNELSFDGEVLGHVQLRLTLEGIPPGEPPDVFGEGGLTKLHLDLDSRRFLTGFALSPLLPFLPDQDPGGFVEASKREVVVGLRALLPISESSSTTIEALAGVVSDFPHPQHPFTIDVSSQSPVTAQVMREAIGNSLHLAALLKRLTIIASYTGTIR